MKSSRSLVLGFALLLPALAAAQIVPDTAAVLNVSQTAPAARDKHRNQNKGKGKRPHPTASIAKVAPEWTIKGGSAFKDNGTRAFYGVGSAPSTISDEYLRRETADNRARANIQNAFTASIESTGTTTQTADGGVRVEHVRTTLEKGKISMAQIVDHYQAADGTLYSLAKKEIARREQGQPAGKP